MCDVKTEIKYLKRPSPPRPANDPGCRGKTFTGNDGNKWTSIVTSSGFYKWVKTKKMAKSVLKKTPGKKSLSKTPVKKSLSKKSPMKKSISRKTLNKKTFVVILNVKIFENIKAEKSLYLCSNYLSSVKVAVKSQIEAMTLYDQKIKVKSITCNNRILTVKVQDMIGNYNSQHLIGEVVDTSRITNGIHWRLYATVTTVTK